MALITPFNYNQYLIGEEMIYRALSQQKTLAAAGQYGMTWSQAEALERDDYETKYQSARQSFTGVPQHCIPYPPCPWDKQQDRVSYDEFWDVLMQADSVNTYRISVHLRMDNGTSSFTVGAEVISYTPDQDALDSSIRNQWRYFKKEGTPGAIGTAVVVIDRMAGGAVDKTFYYLFDLN